MDNQLLKQQQEVIDFRIIFDNALTFNQHVQKVFPKKIKNISFIVRNLLCIENSNTFTALYNKLVLSMICYSDAICYTFQDF